MKNLAIVGIGYWGKKLVSEFSKIANIKFCYSQGNTSNINWIHRNYPKVNFCKNFQDILNVVNNDERLREMSENAKRLVLERFQLKIQIKKYDEMYKDVINRFHEKLLEKI